MGKVKRWNVEHFFTIRTIIIVVLVCVVDGLVLWSLLSEPLSASLPHTLARLPILLVIHFIAWIFLGLPLPRPNRMSNEDILYDKYLENLVQKAEAGYEYKHKAPKDILERLARRSEALAVINKHPELKDADFVKHTLTLINDDATTIFETENFCPAPSAKGWDMEHLNESQKTLNFLTRGTWIIFDEGIDQFHHPNEVWVAAKKLGLSNLVKMLTEYKAWLKSIGAKSSLKEVNLWKLEEENPEEYQKTRDKINYFSSEFAKAWAADEVPKRLKQFVLDNIDNFVYES
ncbi:MAG: hypothetical protein LBQ02_00020 [Candidatus Nomurabacteria bacterium]|jgi:hypothetical protein|nr:hypothetical protein [Candidatus Nomurabacteria bacterium]